MRKLLVALCSLSLLFGTAVVWVTDAAAFEGVVNDSGVRARSAPSLSASVVKVLAEGQSVDVVGTASGSSVGGNRTWYRLPSGVWVSSSLISRGASSSASSRGGLSGRWVDVDISSQTARAMQGNSVVYSAGVTTGKPGFDTPTGTFYIQSRPGTVNMRGADYFQPNVRYTQYFNGAGDALHANYWQPASVFGNVATSHGCVGMPTGDAAFFWNFARIGTPVVIHY